MSARAIGIAAALLVLAATGCAAPAATAPAAVTPSVPASTTPPPPPLTWADPVPGIGLDPGGIDGSGTPATPESSTVARVSGAPVVVLDPGHNGANGENPGLTGRQVPDGRGGMKDCNTTGTSTDAGYPEHEFNWDVTGRVAQRLAASGVQVVLTREDDAGVGPCVDERGTAGERADADAVVSIHADGSAPGNSGFHVAYSDPPLNPAQRGPSVEFAATMRDALRSAGFADSDYVGRAGLSPRADLAGLNHSTRPTVLVECANMRNPAEAALVSSEAGRDRYAAAITTGILAFLGQAG